MDKNELSKKLDGFSFKSISKNTGGATMQPDPDCCQGWLRIARTLQWFSYENHPGIAVAPHILFKEGGDSRDMVRVNFCPSCGANVRNIKMSVSRLTRDSDDPC